MNWGVLAELRANLAETLWRAVMAVFALIWLRLAVSFAWGPFFLMVALVAAGNAGAAWVGFERYGNLIVAIAVLFSVLDLALCAVYGGMLYIGSLDWSGVVVSH